ncbi:MAG: nucleotidyltransferase [Clostridia bacterium]|nr:nucleotidyltransferase [Clostridia bacterium]
MEEKTLLILAAGMGSRFGGLKQIEPIDDNGNFIIDYSIYDAIRAGFNKVVFVIRKQNFDIFKETVGKRIEKHINVEYVFQEMDSFVCKTVDGRSKPWGTGHAVLCAKEKINGNFIIINADDFYGLDAYKTAINFMQQNQDPKTYAIVAYKVGNTLTENGSVKRGICQVKDGLLTQMVESVVQKNNQDKILATPLAGGEEIELKFDHPVSMNLMCLHSDFFDYLQRDFNKFQLNMKDEKTQECLIQDVMFNQTQEEGAIIKVVETEAVWHGVTYKEDKPQLVKQIKSLIESNLYPQNLWSK